MAKITSDQIEKAYEYGNKVYSGEMTKTSATNELSNMYSMAKSSAQMYIEAVQYMLLGRGFGRNINNEAAEYYLQKILADYGDEAFQRALFSLEQFVEYYESQVGGSQQGKRELIKQNGGFKDKSYWIFQGNPDEYDIDKYFKSNSYIYWAVRHKKHQESIRIGDPVFLWRAKGGYDNPFGIVAYGHVVEKPKHKDEVKYPEKLLDNLFKRKATSEIRVGIQLEEVRLNLEGGMLEASSLSAQDSLKDMAILTVRQGSNFQISEEQYKVLHNIWEHEGNRSVLKMYSFQSLNEYISQLTSSDYHLTASHNGNLTFGSDIRSVSRFMIDCEQLVTGLRELLDNGLDLNTLDRFEESDWREIAKLAKNSDVFRTLLKAQTKATFVLISQIINWAIDTPADKYKDDIINFNNESLEQAITALNTISDKSKFNTVSELNMPPGNGQNIIVYGAPGSGKSHYIKQMTEKEKFYITVFHPEYQNSDFVGSLRPHKDEDDITYAFVPGPFIDALIEASQNPDKQVFLIIEEINRANAAAVFGEVFLLLDRVEEGYSEYGVTPDAMLQQHLGLNGYANPADLRIPANLTLLATMNSSDQGVFLLDSAFKRRWGFKYCPIDFSSHSKKKTFSDKVVPYNGKEYSWTDFAQVINEALQQRGIEEDRLIGPFFLTDKERETLSSCKAAISGKLLIYLWDDVLRHGMRDQLFSSKFTTFSKLVNDYNNSKQIFTESVESLLDTYVQVPDNDEGYLDEAQVS